MKRFELPLPRPPQRQLRRRSVWLDDDEEMDDELADLWGAGRRPEDRPPERG